MLNGFNKLPTTPKLYKTRTILIVSKADEGSEIFWISCVAVEEVMFSQDVGY